MIPEDAVEAAAKAVFIRYIEPEDWDLFTGQLKKRYMVEARAALEAGIASILGTGHPCAGDHVTIARTAHIALCPECQQRFG